MAPEAPLVKARPRELALPDPGVAEIWQTENGWTALVNRAPRLGVLHQVAAEAGFRLEIAPEATQLEGSVTLRAADVAIEEILEALLDGVAYGLHYEPDPETQLRVLTRVALPAREAGGDRLAPNQAHDFPLTLPDDDARRAPASLAFLDQLRNPDPEVRASAAEWISLEPRTFPDLAELLRNHPDAAVRVAAATTLGDAMNKPEEREAVAVLLGALHHDEPEVVIAALDALESVGDAGIARGLGFLLQHPSAEVRKAAADTI